MQISHRIHEKNATIILSGKFVFTAHREFRDQYQVILDMPEIQSLDIDLWDVDYIDSSALGTLLMVKELAEIHNVKLSLARCRGMVLEVLKTVNFGQIFTITT